MLSLFRLNCRGGLDIITQVRDVGDSGRAQYFVRMPGVFFELASL